MRSVNLSELLEKVGVNGSVVQNEVEIAVPTFLRSSVKDIVSIGKSVNLIRCLDPHYINSIE